MYDEDTVICKDGKYRYVYLIKNDKNGKTYVGQHTTKDLNDKYFGSGKALKLAINKYGKENFELGFLDFVNTQEELNEREKIWIQFFRDHEWRGNYNIKDGGQGEHSYSHPEEIRKKISEKAKGRVWSQERRKAMSQRVSGENHPLFNVGHSEETKDKFKQFHKNRKNLECPHCGKTMDYVNAKRYHFDKCPKNPEYEPKIIVCPWCKKIGTKMSAMVLWHFDNCRNNPNSKKKRITCPYCKKSSFNHAVFKAYHFKNCKENPDRKIKKDIICPYCGKIGSRIGTMKQFHFDNCKYKNGKV